MQALPMPAEARIYLADSRTMAELADESVHLVVTSPPYWHLKDYGVKGQIGYGQSLHEYLRDLSRVWRECWRVLKPGRRLCINVGDHFARAALYGRYRVIPLHAEIIAQCETLGFDYMGAIIWRKKTTMRPTGGAVVMGSFPYPPNGIVEVDYEFVLLFRKPGQRSVREPVPPAARQASRLSREEWKEFFSGHWEFAGERQVMHEAMFPEELPRRLIRMFSFVGETVLDPFLGSGTTVKVALELGRNAIGYEIQPACVPIICQRLGMERETPPVSIVRRVQALPPVEPPGDYVPRVKDARPLADPKRISLGSEAIYRVTALVDERTVQLENGWIVQLLGITVPPERREHAMAYLRQFVVGKRVILRSEGLPEREGAPIRAYLYLRNRLFINRKMVAMGLADADRTVWHRYRERFLKVEAERRHSEGMQWGTR